MGGRLSNVAGGPVALRWQQPFDQSGTAHGPFQASQSHNRNRASWIWTMVMLSLGGAKWSIGIGQPLWRRAMMLLPATRCGVPQRPRPAPDFTVWGRGDPYGLH